MLIHAGIDAFIFQPVWRMDLGLDFDDSDFAKEEKPKQLLTSYNAKICSPQVRT